MEPTTWLLVTGWDSTPAEQSTYLFATRIRAVGACRRRRLVVQFTLDGDDAAALQKIAHDQGENPGEVVRALIRAASDRAA
jgi:hypothetical protein